MNKLPNEIFSLKKIKKCKREEIKKNGENIKQVKIFFPVRYK